MSGIDFVKLRAGAVQAAQLTVLDVQNDPVWAAVVISRLVQSVTALLTERELVVERLQLMAAAERETADGARGRAIGLETAAEVVAGGSPL